MSTLNLQPNSGGDSDVDRPHPRKLMVEASVLDFGADPAGFHDSTKAFAAAIGSGAYNIHVPTGVYEIDRLVVNKYIHLHGDGRGRTIVRVHTTSDHGVDLAGDPAYFEDGDGGNLVRMSGLTFRYDGKGQPEGKHGLFVRVKSYLDEVFVDGFTNTGIYTTSYLDESDPRAHARTPFFMHFNNVWSKNNGQDGMQLRWGSNANVLVNCSFDKNGRYGFYHHTGVNQGHGIGTYGSTIIGGQCSYNGQDGWRFESGGNLSVMGIYAEGNGRAHGEPYVNTKVDYYCAAKKSSYKIGTLFMNDNEHIYFDPADRTVEVMVGGSRKSAICGGVSKVPIGADLAAVTAKLNALLDELALRKITNGS